MTPQTVDRLAFTGCGLLLAVALALFLYGTRLGMQDRLDCSNGDRSACARVDQPSNFKDGKP